MTKTVFLDLDGTLTDSGPGIISSIKHTLETMGYPPLQDDGRWLVGPALWDSFRKLGLPEDALDPAVAIYREKYKSGDMLNAVLYPDVLAQLEQLKDAGYRLCLATSKAIAYATDITLHFGIAPYLDQQFGSELDGTRADKPSLIAYGLAQTGTLAHDAVMIGDRHYDISGAKANNIKSIGVAYGYGGEEELRTAGADAVIQHPHQLAETIQSILPIT